MLITRVSLILRNLLSVLKLANVSLGHYYELQTNVLFFQYIIWRQVKKVHERTRLFLKNNFFFVFHYVSMCRIKD